MQIDKNQKASNFTKHCLCVCVFARSSFVLSAYLSFCSSVYLFSFLHESVCWECVTEQSKNIFLFSDHVYPRSSSFSPSFAFIVTQSKKTNWSAAIQWLCDYEHASNVKYMQHYHEVPRSQDRQHDDMVGKIGKSMARVLNLHSDNWIPPESYSYSQRQKRRAMRPVTRLIQSILHLTSEFKPHMRMNEWKDIYCKWKKCHQANTKGRYGFDTKFHTWESNTQSSFQITITSTKTTSTISHLLHYVIHLSPSLHF